MPTVYKQVLCPKCKVRLYSALVSSNYTHKTGVNCPRCHVHYVVEYGQGKAKVTKG